MVSRANEKQNDRGHSLTRRNAAPSPAAETMARQEHRLAGMLSVAPDAIIAVDTGSRIRVFNTGAESLFGHRADDVIGQPLDLLIPDRFRNAHTKHMAGFRAAPEQSKLMTERSEVFGIRADGSEFLAEASVFKLNLDGETILTAMLHDVTARKQAEAALITAKKQAETALIQAEKMAALGTLASGIGHEINNPLYAILGAAEAIRDGGDLDLGQEHAKDIIGYCKHIGEIIKNLAGYSQPAEKHGLEPVDVNAALAEALSMAQLTLRAETIETEQHLAAVPAISAKSEDVQQAFFNVIRNALQAMGREGILRIESLEQGGQISIRIGDTGSGIAQADMARIYDPFFTTKGPDEGEGIGLFVVRQIVKKIRRRHRIREQCRRGDDLYDYISDPRTEWGEPRE